MKRILFALVMLVALAFSANALVIEPALIGSTSQERDVNVTASVNIRNDLNETVNVTAVTISGLDAAYNLKLLDSAVPFQLTTGATKTFTMQAYLPPKFNAVDNNLAKVSFKIGTVSATGVDSANASNTRSATADVNAQAENRLEISKMKLIVNGGSEQTLRDGSSKEVKPGDEAIINVEVKNYFSSSSSDFKNTDITMDDVRVYIDVADDTDLSFDSSDESTSLAASDKDTLEFKFTVADDARAKTHSVRVRVDSVDEYGAKHGQSQTFNIKVTRESHDLTIKSVEVQPTRIYTDTKTVQFTASIYNRGSIDEDEAYVQVKIPALNIVEKSVLLSLSKDDSTTEVLTVQLPKDVKAGTYDANIYTLYDLTKQDSVKTVQIIVESPETTVVTQPTTTVTTQPTTTVTTQPTTTTTTTPTTTQPVQSIQVASAQTKVMSDTTYLLLLGAGILVALIVLGLFIRAIRH